MNPAGRVLPVLMALAFAFSLGGDASAEIFQYKDANGVIHFANRKAATSPAPAGASAAIRVNKPTTAAFAPQDKNLQRFTRYDEWIRQAATLYQIPEPLVRAVIKVESDYDARAISVAGARGLMQLMPDTADRLQVRDIHDPRENIFGGVRLLRILANAFNGDLELTVAAYNAGEEAVQRFRGIPPYAQTRQYVSKVTGYYRRYRTTRDIVEASVGEP
ncbi:lytic transglycosylase domain-containing protein [Pendulispora rubella]|uniref:Lytic transglycosylase domain-containing protein n=1 Tax=Pendulispora rubella TaxID=2741070 RepID=A0ABZ2L0K0_9BACT